MRDLTVQTVENTYQHPSNNQGDLTDNTPRSPSGYTADDWPSNDQHSHCLDYASLDLALPGPNMPRQEHDSSDKYSEEPDTSYHLLC